MAKNISYMPHSKSGSGWKGVTGVTRTFWRTPRPVLGPLMFLTYINDIDRNISGTIKLFADDALLFRQIRSDADCRKTWTPLIILMGSEVKNVI